MKEISDLFQGLVPIKEELLAFGFSESGGEYRFSHNFSNGDFQMLLMIIGKKVLLEVIDLATEESYSPFFVAHPMGSFVRQMREESDEIILKIKETCFEKDYENDYIARFDRFVKEEFDVLPEVTWEEYPNFFTYHRKDNRKWFAIIIQAEYRKLGIEKDGLANIIDFKADSNDIPLLLEREDLFPGYHMNKKHWLTFLLDGSSPFENLVPLIRKSYELAKGKEGPKGQQGYWLVPGNPKYYDVAAHLAKSKEILWKQSSKVEVGDEVYLYDGQPIGAIRFVFEAKEVNIPYSYDGEVKMEKAMRLYLKKELKEPFTKKELAEFGVLYIRGPRSMPKELIEALKKRK